MPKPFEQEDRQFYEKFLNKMMKCRDELNGFSAIYNVAAYDLNECGEDGDEDEYNELAVLYTPDSYVISGNFSEMISGLMNYLSFVKDEDLEPYEDDFNFTKRVSCVQHCFNMAYGYKWH